jgi:hypothetical protein
MRIVNPIYESYNEALQKLNFGTDMFVVKITDDLNSLETMRYDKHVIKVLGTGLMKSPGHPSGNQLNNNQLPFFDTLTKHNHVPVLHKQWDGVVEFLGYYRHLDTKIRVSNEGFRYYEYTLQRYNKSNEMQ